MSSSTIDKDTCDDAERQACIRVDYGFHIRHPPPPHELGSFITDDEQLFQTIHMGSAVVDQATWTLVITGLVKKALRLTLEDLKELPNKTVLTFHECYGPPTAPPTKAYRRVGNVKWTGVPLRYLLDLVSPLEEAQYVWSDGLDHGTFAGQFCDRYQKDLPISKAMNDEVLVAYLLNGEPLNKERGGPVRLVVPGWFGTNSTKWLCKLSLQAERSKSPYTTKWYNEIDPTDPSGQRMRPIWNVEPNSIIVHPKPDETVSGHQVLVEGWAWSCDGIDTVEISLDRGTTWQQAHLEKRTEYSWQKFRMILHLSPGTHEVMACATCDCGVKQPLAGRRNHVHSVRFSVLDKDDSQVH